MWIALLLSLIVLAAVLLLRYRRGRALSQAARQLQEARSQPGKRLRLSAPDRPVEELLAQINGLLEDRETETRQLRERDSNCKIILVDDTQEFAVQGMRLHCTDFILRPVEFRHIVRSMNLALRGWT